MTNNNLTGIELITAERQEQIEKHGYSLEHDREHDRAQLVAFAISILTESALHLPYDWDKKYLYKILLKDRSEQLTIAGALIAAEIDRINFIKEFEKNN